MTHTMTTEPARNFLEGLRVGNPVTVHNVTMFPLLGEDRPGPAYTTLHQALASKTASISEISEGGSVPELLFRNDGDIAVFLLDGEELIGAKQNRILNISILVPAKTTIKIPVSCVEQGRWRYTSGDFSSSNRTLFAAARKAKMMRVSENMRSQSSRASDQGEVWDQIQGKLGSLGARSASSAMSDAFESRAQPVEEIAGNLRAVAEQRGALFAIGSRIEGLELFDRHASLAGLLASIARGYALDAVEHEGTAVPAPTMEEVSRLLHAVNVATVQRYPAVGLGEDLRLESEDAFGAALDVEGRVVHLTAFAGKAEASPSRRGRMPSGWRGRHH
jgi:hypothetical protein